MATAERTNKIQKSILASSVTYRFPTLDFLKMPRSANTRCYNKMIGARQAMRVCLVAPRRLYFLHTAIANTIK
jgi:hypothetical protein